MRFLIAMLVAFVVSTTAYAQVSLKGPEKASPGEAVKLQIIADADDLKVTVLKQGKPTDQGWFALKELDNTPILLFFTKEEAVFTVIVAGNKAGKTLIAVQSLEISSNQPTPTPPPSPQPTPSPQSGFAAVIQLKYNIAPDPTTLKSLIDIFTETKSRTGNMKTYADLQATIVVLAKEKLEDGKLTDIRKLISQYLVENTSDDPRQWDKSKTEKALDDILTALKGCK